MKYFLSRVWAGLFVVISIATALIVCSGFAYIVNEYEGVRIFLFATTVIAVSIGILFLLGSFVKGDFSL